MEGERVVAPTAVLPAKPMTRHQITAMEFKHWLADNPDAPKKKRIRKFNEIADEIYGR